MGIMVKDNTAGLATAGTTQTFAGATPILNDVTILTTGTANDGVLLPQAAPGQVVVIKNTHATNAAKAYAPNSGTIDGTAGATGVALAAAKTTMYVCTGYVAGGVGPVYVTLYSV